MGSVVYHSLPAVAGLDEPAPTLGRVHRNGSSRGSRGLRETTMDNQTAWVDAGRCAGCGTCVPICPVDAIAAVNGKARVDDGCTGCAACVDVCPEGAIQLAIQGELVAVPERAIPIPYRPSPLVETAGTAAVAAGVGLLAKAAAAVARAVTVWLTGPTTDGGRSAADDQSSTGPRGGGGGRRARRRRRGG